MTSVGLFSSVRWKSLASVSRMCRTARSYGVLESRKNASAFARRSPGYRQAAPGKLPQIEGGGPFLVMPGDGHDTPRFVDDLALRAPRRVASYAAIGGDHQRVIRLVDQSHHAGGS